MSEKPEEKHFSFLETNEKKENIDLVVEIKTLGNSVFLIKDGKCIEKDIEEKEIGEKELEKEIMKLLEKGFSKSDVFALKALCSFELAGLSEKVSNKINEKIREYVRNSLGTYQKILTK